MRHKFLYRHLKVGFILLLHTPSCINAYKSANYEFLKINTSRDVVKVSEPHSLVLLQFLIIQLFCYIGNVSGSLPVCDLITNQCLQFIWKSFLSIFGDTWFLIGNYFHTTTWFRKAIQRLIQHLKYLNINIHGEALRQVLKLK